MTDAQRQLLADHVRCAREATAEARAELEAGERRRLPQVMAALVDAQTHTAEALAILAEAKGSP